MNGWLVAWLLLLVACAPPTPPGTILGGDLEEGDASTASPPQTDTGDGDEPLPGDDTGDASPGVGEGDGDGDGDEPTPGDESDADAGVPDGPPVDPCVFDPNEVYLVGRLDAEGTMPFAVMNLSHPERICTGFTDFYDGYIRYSDSKVVYRDAGFSSSTAGVRVMAPDELIWDEQMQQYSFGTPEENDELIHTIGCKTYGALLGAPDRDDFVYTCDISTDVRIHQAYWSTGDYAAPRHFDAEAVSFAGLLIGFQVTSMSDTGSYGGNDALMQDGMSTEVVGLSTYRATADGFIGADAGKQYSISATGEKKEIGRYVADLSTSLQSFPVMDAEGALYYVAKMGTKRVVVRRPLAPGQSRVIYEGPTAGATDLTVTPPKLAVYLEQARLITGP